MDQRIAKRWNLLGIDSGWLLHDAVIEMDISSFPFDGTAIGTAGSVGRLRPPNGGFVHHLIPNKILNGQDNNGEESDGHIDIYFFGPEDTFSYQPDPDLGIADDQIDFQAVIIHELMHALGFTSATNANGTDDSGDGFPRQVHGRYSTSLFQMSMGIALLMRTPTPPPLIR